MKKRFLTTIDDNIYQILKDFAHIENISMAELNRRALVQFFNENPLLSTSAKTEGENMNFEELVQFEKLRTTLKSITAQHASVSTAMTLLATAVDEKYYSICQEIADRTTSKKLKFKSYDRSDVWDVIGENIPLSMRMKVPDAPYAFGCGDDCSQKLK
jgi:hypothetical protein